MKKWFLFSVLIFFSISCVLLSPQQSFDEQVATRAAISLTATALDKEIKNDSQEPSPVPDEENGEDQQPTETIPPDNPKEDLGSPSFRDTLSPNIWIKDSDEFDAGGAIFTEEDGYLRVVDSGTGDGNRWFLYFEKVGDAYIETKFEISACSGNDEYGMVFHAVDYEGTEQLHFALTCDGEYGLSKMDSVSLSPIISRRDSDSIKSGSNQSNLLGVWVEDDVIRLYINNQFIDEIESINLPDSGYYGMFVNARQTPGLTVRLDEVNYWILE